MSGWPFDPHHDIKPTTTAPAPLPPAKATRAPDYTPDYVRMQRDLAAAQRRSRANTNLVVGALLLGVGALITFGTYSSASSNPHGGTYFIAYGPIAYGFIRLCKGIFSR